MGVIVKKGSEALMKATSRGNATECARLLPDSDPNALCSFGCTPLQMATLVHSMPCFEVLLSASDPNVRNAKGSTVLHLVATRGQTEMAKLLIPISDLKARNSAGQTPWQVATECGHDDIAQLILEHQALTEAKELQRHLLTSSKSTVSEVKKPKRTTLCQSL